MSASPKTTRTDASVQDFLASVKSDAQRADAQVLVDMFRGATGDEPAMWGPSIIGFGEREIIGANVRKLADVDAAVLRELVDASLA